MTHPADERLHPDVRGHYPPQLCRGAAPLPQKPKVDDAEDEDSYTYTYDWSSGSSIPPRRRRLSASRSSGHTSYGTDTSGLAAMSSSAEPVARLNSSTSFWGIVVIGDVVGESHGSECGRRPRDDLGGEHED